MFLKNIKLNNFRNYSQTHFKFENPITIFVGSNAQGKTNFLESVYFLATTKSTRAEKDEELIKWGENLVRVEGELEIGTGLEVVVQKIEDQIKKRVTVNGVPRRVSEYSENLAVVLFAPDDINLVNGSPSLRRSYLDRTLSQVDRNYKRIVANYEDVITRRNKVLKRIREGLSRLDELDFWSAQQLNLARVINQKREHFFHFVNSTEKKFGDFEYLYLKSEINSERLKEYQQREIDSATSLIGPHRDDFAFLLDSLDLSKFGSRAQQRTAVLDLKMSEVSFIESILGNRPILLLDDIFSELDSNHREHVIAIANLQQTLIAAVEIDELLSNHLNQGTTIVSVSTGSLKEIKTLSRKA